MSIETSGTKADRGAAAILPDRAIGAADLPWVPLAPGVEFQPRRFNMATGQWTNVLRIQPGAQLSRHRHNGGPVSAYCLEGSWWYLERDWVATVGSFIWEPPGDIHTLQAGPQGMTTLFVTDGVLQYFDEHDVLDHEDNVFTRYQAYVDHCERTGIAVVDLLF